MVLSSHQKLLHLSRDKKATAELKQLLEQDKGIVNQTDADGRSALMHAARCGNTPAVALLLHAGANINAATPYGWTALMAACYNGNVEVAYILIGSYLEKNFSLPKYIFKNKKLRAYIRGILKDYAKTSAKKDAKYDQKKIEITHISLPTHKAVSLHIIPVLGEIVTSYLNKMPYAKISTVKAYTEQYKKIRRQSLSKKSMLWLGAGLAVTYGLISKKVPKIRMSKKLKFTP